MKKAAGCPTAFFFAPITGTLPWHRRIAYRYYQSYFTLKSI